MKLCIPVLEDRGLRSEISGHFGSAPVFLLIDDQSGDLQAISNGDLGHAHGKCQPLSAIAGREVNAVIVGGIGAGAVSKLIGAGIQVFRAEQAIVEQTLEDFRAGRLSPITVQGACGHHGAGGCGHHH